LKVLNISTNGIKSVAAPSHEAVNEICQFMYENSSLEVLDLGSTKLQKSDACEIFHTLGNNASLKILNICHNNEYLYMCICVSLENLLFK